MSHYLSRYFFVMCPVFFIGTTVAMQKTIYHVHGQAHFAIKAQDVAWFKNIAAGKGFDPNAKYASSAENYTDNTILHFLLLYKPATPEFIREVFTIIASLPQFDPNVTDKEGITPLMLLFMRHKKRPLPADCLQSLFSLLLALPTIDVTIENKRKITAIDYAPLSVDFIRPLIERGAQPLLSRFWDARQKQPEVFDYLVKNSNAAVFYAISQYDLELFRKTIALPTFKPNAFYKEVTPLMFALQTTKSYNRTSQETFVILDALLQVPGVDINLISPDNFTSAFSYAALAGVPYVRYVMTHGMRMRPIDYEFVVEEGAPGVLDYIKKLPIELQQDSGSPECESEKRLAPPPGQDTVEQSFKTVEDHQSMIDDEKKCAHCQAPNCNQYCGGCKQVYYCSVDHQRADWPEHKKKFHQL